MELTYFEFIGSLRKYLQETTGTKTIWKYYGYKKPTEKPFIEIEYVNSSLNELTKSKELIHEDIFLNVGIHGVSITELSKVHKSVMPILMYDTIPIINSDLEEIGKFSVENINGVSNIMYGTQVEDESSTHRLYIDISIPVAHVKKRIINGDGA